METMLEIMMEMDILGMFILALVYIVVSIRAIITYLKDVYMLYIVISTLTLYPLFMMALGVSLITSFSIALLVFNIVELVDIDTED